MISDCSRDAADVTPCLSRATSHSSPPSLRSTSHLNCCLLFSLEVFGTRQCACCWCHPVFVTHHVTLLPTLSQIYISSQLLFIIFIRGTWNAVLRTWDTAVVTSCLSRSTSHSTSPSLRSESHLNCCLLFSLEVFGTRQCACCWCHPVFVTHHVTCHTTPHPLSDLNLISLAIYYFH